MKAKMKYTIAIFIIVLTIPVFSQEWRWSDPVPVVEVNTINNENYTYLSTDGSILLWNAQGTICMSRWDGEAWQPRELLPEPVNSEHLENAVAITPDHSHFYWVSWRPGGFGGWDIWRCSWEESTNTFGEAECLGENINSESAEFGIGFTPDGNRIYYSSSVFIQNGQQGYGDLDIWYCDWDSTLGDWGLPYNVGSPINTPGPEFAPYITRNGTMVNYTLFFSGYGPHDVPCWQGNSEIFYAIWDGESWSEVVNICPPINTDRANESACLTQDGGTIYFISVYESEPDMHGEIMVSERLLSIDELENSLPGEVILNIYPNPSNTTFHIQIEYLTTPSNLKIYDMLGRLVNEFALDADDYTIEWNGTDSGGAPVSTGMYFAVIESGGQQLARKMILLK